MKSRIAEYYPLIQKHLSKNEAVNYRLTRFVPPFCMIVTNKRKLFFREENDTMTFLYDSRKLTSEWRKGRLNFKRSFLPADTDVYLHLVLSFIDSQGYGASEPYDATREYILSSPDMNLKEIMNKVELLSTAFKDKLDLHKRFAAAYFWLGMMKKSAAFHRIIMERMPKPSAIISGLYYLTVENYEKAVSCMNEAKRAYIRKWGTDLDRPTKAMLNGNISWVMAMRDWKKGKFGSAYNNFLLAYRFFLDMGNEQKSDLMLSLSMMVFAKKTIPDLGSLIRYAKDYEFTGERVAKVWYPDTEKRGESVSDEGLDKVMSSKDRCELMVINSEAGKEVYFKGELQKSLSPLLHKMLAWILKNRGNGGSVLALLENVWGESKDTLQRIRQSLKIPEIARKNEDKVYTRKTDKAVGVLNKYLESLKVRIETKKTGQYRLSRNLKYCLIEY